MKLNNFAAIDFEIANSELSSICSVGVVIVRDRKIVDKIYNLIRPEPEYYWSRFTEIHGLRWEDTCNERVFSDVWTDITTKIEGLPLVAHNSSFDEGCLKLAFRVYQMEYPDYKFFCTYKAARRVFGQTLPNHQLQTVAAYCGYNLENHHYALADAEAAAAIALKIM